MAGAGDGPAPAAGSGRPGGARTLRRRGSDPAGGRVGEPPPARRGVRPLSDPREALGRVQAEVGKAVVGQQPTVWGMLCAALVRGHVILEGVPGVAKTLMVKAMATSLDLDFRRI